MAQQKTTTSRALPIAIMFALFFMIAFVTGYQNPLGSVIKQMTAGNALASQLGNFATFIAYAFMGFPAGVMLQKKGYRATSLTAVSVGFGAVLLTYLSQFMPTTGGQVGLYLTGAFASGFAVCMLNTVVNPMLNSLGRNENEGNQLLLFGGAFNSLGATLAPMVVGFLMGAEAKSIGDANAVFVMAMAIFALAFVVIYRSELPEHPNLGKETEQPSVLGAFKYRHFVLGVVAIFCYVGTEVGIANITYQYIENYLKPSSPDTATATAGAVVGIYWLLMLVGRTIGGIVGGKISSRTMLATVATAGIVLVATAILLPEESVITLPGISNADGLRFTTAILPVAVALLTLCGLCTSVMWGSIFNLSVAGLGKYTHVASGIFMVMVCGGGILPAIQGWLVGEDHYMQSFWLIVGLLGYQLFYALIGSRRSTRQA